jgi:hypothetical protein
LRGHGPGAGIDPSATAGAARFFGHHRCDQSIATMRAANGKEIKRHHPALPESG